MVLDRRLNILIVTLIGASAGMALAQEKADAKATKSASDQSKSDTGEKKQEAVQSSAQPAVSSIPVPPASAGASELNEVAAGAASVQVTPGPQPAQALGQPSSEQPAQRPSEFYSNYPTGPQPVRFFERTSRADSKAGPPNITRRPPRRHGSAGAPIAIGMGYDRSWPDDDGYRLFGKANRIQQFALWVGYDVWTVVPNAVMAAEIGWAGSEEKKSGDLEGQVKTTLVTQTAHIGVNLRWTRWSFLQPHLRLAGGFAFLNEELKFPQYGQYGTKTVFKDNDGWLPFASLGAGLTVRTPARTFESGSGDFASLSFGVLFEGGYTLAAPANFSLKPKEPAKDSIALKSADLGKLDRSGGYLRISAVVRF